MTDNSYFNEASGSQPGVRIPPGVREKSQGVRLRQFKIYTKIVNKNVIQYLLTSD